jgi:RND family efflux transporter MFP subunit
MLRKSFIYLLPLTLFFASTGCRTGNEDGKAARERLATKKEQYRRLRAEIDSLEERLELSDSSAGKGRRILVRTRELEPQRFEHGFKVNGSVKAEREVLLTAERQGTLQEILVEEGDRVQKGELIAKQDQDILHSRLREVTTRYEHARTLYQKQERLWKDKGVGSELDYLNAKNEMEALRAQKRSLEEELEMSRIEAPIDGTVEELRLKEGAYAAPSKPIAHIIGMEKLSVEADLSESYLSDINEGDTVTVHFPMLGLEFERPIRSLGDRIDPQDRTFKARIRLENTEDRAIKPNLSARLHFTDLRVDSARIIPSGIVQSDPKGEHVYVATPSDTARKRYIEVGPSQEGRSLVKKGLELGEKVVVAGQDELRDGAAIREEEGSNANRRTEER